MPTKDTHIIDVRTKGAKKSEKQIKGVSGALGGMAKQAGIAAAAYFGGRALLSGIRQSIDLFAKQGLAEKKLEAALGHTSKGLLAHAKALQEVTMFGDETIIEAQALIGSFVKEEEAIKAATQATLDLAAAKGFDLVAAADLVSKTLGSSTNALTRYGIEVKGAVGSTERLESLTGNIAAVFGGQATAQTETLAGALAQMNNAVGDAGEALGETLAPMIIASANAVKFMAEAFESLFSWQDKYKHLALETLGIVSEQEAKLILLNQELKTNADATSVVEAMLLTLNNQLDDTSMAMGENADSSSRWTKEMLEASIISGDFNALIEDQVFWGTELGQKLEALMIIYESLPEGLTVATDAQVQYNEQQLKALEATKEQKRLQEEFIKLYPKEARALGLTTEEAKKKQKALTVLGQISKGDALGSGRVSQLSAIINTAEAVTEFLAKGSWGEALLAAAMGAKEVNAIESSISKFATGANFITDGPTAMIVGDNPSGEELVQVTPLGGDPNEFGPQGGGITLNIQGSVIGTEEFVEDVLLEQIKEGMR